MAATAVFGTHSTGMHSCPFIILPAKEYLFTFRNNI